MHVTDFERLSNFDPVGKTRTELERALEGCGRLAAYAAAKKLACLAAIEALGDDGVKPADANRTKTRASSKKSKRAARTAKQLPSMPTIQQALADGEISEEHADAAADAAARVSPEEADAELTKLALLLPADRFAAEANDWAGKRESDKKKETAQDRARRERTGVVWQKKNGRIGINGELDPVAGKPVLQAFERAMARLFREDGGRDGDPATMRTYAQRGADALTELIAGGASAGSAGSAAANRRPHPRFVTHVRIDADRCRADDPSGFAAFLDGTPLPQSVLERIACESAFVGSIFAADGSILWQGRAVRLATDDQWNALIDRDGGCIHCGADPARCQAHHLVPWSPPTFGETDIDDLTLVCATAHSLIHDHGYRVVIDDAGRYRLVEPGARAGPTAQAA
ncbi:MAG: hypothetical protein DHS20C19_20640 [Acidimicrobiales bacterium]|nr:MAG: hypothetical protein DHS20C19_20640 [Acidimicrobiales bacterium]